MRMKFLMLVLIMLAGLPSVQALSLVASSAMHEAEEEVHHSPEVVAAAQAVMREWQNRHSKLWSQVEEVVADASAATPDAPVGVWHSPYLTLYLAPNGMAVQVYTRAPMGAEESETEEAKAHEPEEMAMLSRWRRSDDGFALLAQEVAMRPSEKDPPEEEVRDFLSMFDEEEITMFTSHSPQEVMEKLDAMARGWAEEDPDEESERFLLLKVADGALLLRHDREHLLWHTQRWDGAGALTLNPAFWRADVEDAGLAGLNAASGDYALADPMHPDVPEMLRSLLRTSPIEVQVLGRVDEATPLVWSHHTAMLELHLNRGSEDGLIEGMALFGLPPDEDFRATVTQVEANTAVAMTHVARFSPDEDVPMPRKGTMFSTQRKDAPLACQADTRAAVRAQITHAAMPKDGVVFDDDGFGFLELVIDAGSDTGLAVGDSLYLESEEEGYWYGYGEARVRRVEDGRAHVLWRVVDWRKQKHESHEDEEDAEEEAETEPLIWPKAGQYLVTPSWRRAEREVFGGG